MIGKAEIPPKVITEALQMQSIARATHRQMRDHLQASPKQPDDSPGPPAELIEAGCELPGGDRPECPRPAHDNALSMGTGILGGKRAANGYGLKGRCMVPHERSPWQRSRRNASMSSIGCCFEASFRGAPWIEPIDRGVWRRAPDTLLSAA